jgi:hypothetical protein
MTDDSSESPVTVTAAQVLMSMIAICACGDEHDGYTRCRGQTTTPAERAGIPPLPR